MLAPTVQNVTKIWPTVTEVVFVPHTEQDYQQIVGVLDSLVDEAGEDEMHQLAS